MSALAWFAIVMLAAGCEELVSHALHAAHDRIARRRRRGAGRVSFEPWDR
jgi:hypothetical protein